MNQPLDEALRELLNGVFQMPTKQSMKQRKSSITNAFVNAIIPVITPEPAEIGHALAVLGMSHEDISCAYCGDATTEWDHLRPLVLNKRPTGYISEIANLVPSCPKCNQSKRNQHWREWMLSAARRSPKTRAIADLDERIRRLESYEAWRAPTKVDFEQLLGAEEWSHYWSLWENLTNALTEAQIVADKMSAVVRDRLKIGSGAS